MPSDWQQQQWQQQWQHGDRGSGGGMQQLAAQGVPVSPGQSRSLLPAAVVTPQETGVHWLMH